MEVGGNRVRGSGTGNRTELANRSLVMSFIIAAWWMVGSYMAMEKFVLDNGHHPQDGDMIDVALYGLVEPAVRFMRWAREDW